MHVGITFTLHCTKHPWSSLICTISSRNLVPEGEKPEEKTTKKIEKPWWLTSVLLATWEDYGLRMARANSSRDPIPK
jgi:hypothetical protein